MGVAQPIVLHVYHDENGASRFGEIHLSGGLRQSPASTAMTWLSETVPVKGLTWRRVDQEHPVNTPHVAPTRQLVVQVAGSAEIEASSGERRTVIPGQLILIEDTEGAGHITRRLGEETRVTLIFDLGDEPLPSH